MFVHGYLNIVPTFLPHLQLYVRRGAMPASVDDVIDPWTTFQMTLREPGSMPPAFDLARFLVSSIAFTTHLSWCFHVMSFFPPGIATQSASLHIWGKPTKDFGKVKVKASCSAGKWGGRGKCNCFDQATMAADDTLFRCVSETVTPFDH